MLACFFGCETGCLQRKGWSLLVLKELVVLLRCTIELQGLRKLVLPSTSWCHGCCISHYRGTMPVCNIVIGETWISVYRGCWNAAWASLVH